MSKYQLRPATAADQDLLRHMLHLAIFVPPGMEPPPASIIADPAIARYAAHWGQRPGDLGLVASESGHDAGAAQDIGAVQGIGAAQDIGAAWLRYFTTDEPGFGFVDAATPELTIAIEPAHRGQGVGTQFMAQLFQDAGGPVSLSCDPRNPAYRLYRRFGFAPVPGNERTLLRCS